MNGALSRGLVVLALLGLYGLAAALGLIGVALTAALAVLARGWNEIVEDYQG